MRATARLLSAFAAIALPLTLSATGFDGSARAASLDPALRCGLTKLRATGAEARARFDCEARAVLDLDVLERCPVSAVARRDRAYARSEAPGACTTTGDAGVMGYAVIELLVAVRPILLPGGFVPSRCAAAQLRGVGRAIGDVVAAHVRDARDPDPLRLTADLAAARTRLARAFDRGATAGDCPSGAPSSAVATLLEQAGARWRNLQLGSCPCWTTAQLAASFPPGFFDTAGRGGAVCQATTDIVSVGSADTCLLLGPGGTMIRLPRGGAAFLLPSLCVLVADADPGNTGTCGFPPEVTNVTAEQSDVCIARLRASQPYRTSCP